MEENKQIIQQIIDHLLAEDNREINDPILAAWLAEADSNQQLFEEYKKIWNEAEYYLQPGSFDPIIAWSQTEKRYRGKRKVHQHFSGIRYMISGVAAAALLLFTFYYAVSNSKEIITEISIYADNGFHTATILPDGSEVKLNNGSLLHYSYNSQKKIREVSFEGEGFFTVSGNNEPFIVKLPDGLQVKVLGTTFNLRAYADESFVETALVKGSVELTHKQSSLLMKSGEMAVYNKENNSLKLIEGEITHSYGWLENKFYMENISLSEVCLYLQRQYHVTITLEEKLGDKIRYNGVLKEESILEVMEALSELSGIKYSIKNGKNIHITSK